MPILRKLEKTCDQIICNRNLYKLQRMTVITAMLAFVVNIALIFIANQQEELTPFWESVGTNYFASIFTPFGIILFFEVVLLIFALPKASTRSIARQFEIISLIILFRVFKDVSELRDLGDIVTNSNFLSNTGLDMLGSIILFILIAIFYLTMRQQEHIDNIPDDNKQNIFVVSKKVITVIVAFLVALIGIVYFGIWSVDFIGGSYGSFFEVQTEFFETIFTILIFSDIAIVLISYLLNEDYAIDFRNIGFIASTILIRLSFVTEKPLDIALAVFAVIFAIIVNFSFNAFIKIRNGLQ